MIVIMTYGGFCPRGAYFLPCHVTTRRPVQDHRQRTNSFTLALPELSLCPTAYPLRLIPGDNYLVMNSLPQEAIDEIIDILPHSSLRSSSLVARRWRQQSQQRLFATVWFHSECKVKRWYIGTKTDQGGISSYVRYADFHDIDSWNDPTLFVRLLEGFSSLRTLWVYKTEIPSELLGHILRGEVGKGITTLHLWSPRCPLSTTASIILSLPDLENLIAGFCNTYSGG